MYALLNLNLAIFYATAANEKRTGIDWSRRGEAR
jgi:hypothetical protein